MFGPLGVPELLFILVLALLVFGPRRLPEVGRTIGKAVGEFRRATTELKRSINTEIALEDEDDRPRYARTARKAVEAGDEGAEAGGEVEVTTHGLIMPGTVARAPRESEAAAGEAGEPAAAEAGADEPSPEEAAKAPAGDAELPPPPAAGDRT